MANNEDAQAGNAARDLRALTERAQREPGLAQVLSLLEQAQATEQAIHDMDPAAEHVSGGAFSRT